MRERIWIVVLLTGCASRSPLDALDDDAIAEAFLALHTRVYDLYSLPLDADAVHDWLSVSFEGEALTAQYIEHWGTRVAMNRDATRVDVRRVTHERPAIVHRGPDGAEVEARWSVGGIVHHGSHSHPRVNRYEALYKVAPTAEGMRIVGTRLRRAERVRDPLELAEDQWILDELPTTDGGFLDALELLEGGVLPEAEEP